MLKRNRFVFEKETQVKNTYYNIITVVVAAVAVIFVVIVGKRKLPPKRK